MGNRGTVRVSGHVAVVIDSGKSERTPTLDQRRCARVINIVWLGSFVANGLGSV